VSGDGDPSQPSTYLTPVIDSWRLFLLDDMVCKTFHRLHYHPYCPMAVTNTGAPRWARRSPHQFTTNSGRYLRGRRFLRPSVDPSRCSDVLGMRKGAQVVERASVRPVCARRSRWYHPSSEYAFSCPITVLLSLSTALQPRQYPTSFSSLLRSGFSEMYDCLQDSGSASSPFSRAR